MTHFMMPRDVVTLASQPPIARWRRNAMRRWPFVLTIAALWCALPPRTTRLHSAEVHQARATAFVPAVLWPKQASPIAEPYAPLHDGAFSGPAVAESPDPLVRYRWKNPRATDPFQIYLLRPLTVTTDASGAFGGLDSATTEPTNLVVKGIGSIRFDFGVESAGWLEFDSPDFSGNVEMSISEYNEPGVVNFDYDPEHPIKTLAPKRHGNTFRLELNKQLYEGVRFGWIHVRQFDKPWHISAVRLVCRVKPTNYEGSFSCSDPLLTRVWYTGAYSVKVNLMMEGIGSILMDRGDRLGWTVECGSSLPAALAALGNWDLMRTQLIHTKGGANGIESNVLHWVIGLLYYYRYTGDRATLESFIPDVVAKLDHGNAIYHDPKMAWFAWDERTGAGGDRPNCPESQNGYRMLFLRACRDFAEAMDTLGRNDLAAKYRAMADRRIVELRADPRWPESFGIFAGGGAIIAGVANPEQQERIFAREFADRAGRLANCPFDVYYSLQAMSKMGRHDVALAMARDHWGGQIGCGATTYFEEYRPEWNEFLGPNDPPPGGRSGYTSLAHAWGSGVTSWLTEEILGIKPAAPGFSRIEILPHLGRTLTWVAGSVPTPRGTVSARFDTQSGQCQVTLPANTVGHVGIPKVERQIKSIVVNGQMAWDGQFHAVEHVGGAKADAAFVHLLDVRSGKHNLTVAYEGRTPAFVDVPYVYPIRFVREDAETHGDWGGVYGRDGHVLFNYDGVGKDRRRLPEYVKSVTNHIAPEAHSLNTFHLTARAPDRRALAGDATNGQPRNLGGLHTDYPGWADSTLTVDIAVKSGTKYQLAIYVLDWGNRELKQVVEVIDLETLELAAPMRLVRGFGEGKYLVYACDRSVRLRINQMRNGNPVLNGVFFDPIR